jgi:colanic acid/amylovoran biosynthesis protein
MQSPVDPDRLPVTILETLLALATAGRRGPERLRALASMDAGFSIGGGFLQMRSTRELATVSLIHLSQLAIAKRAGRPLIMLPQSVGPFEGRLQRALARITLRWFSLLLVREEHSAQHIAELDPALADRVRIVPDLAFLSTSDTPPNLERPPSSLRVGIVTRQWWFPSSDDPAADEERYLREMAAFVDGLHAAGHVPVLVVHSDGPTTRGDDRISTDRVRKLATHDPEVVDVATLPQIDDVLATYSSMDLVVSTRLHGALMSMMAGVRAVAVGYEWKSEGIFDALDLAPWHVRIGDVTSDELLELVSRVADYPLSQAWEGMTARRRELEALAGPIRAAILAA